MTTLLMSSRHTVDDQALWRSAIRRGWSVVRARGLHVPEIEDSEIVFYAEALFAPAIAQSQGYRLLDPAEDWLTLLPPSITKRKIELSTLGSARSLRMPTFIKPPNDKSFAAKVYETGEDLPDAFDATMKVLLSEPVKWESEFRCFCFDGQVATLSPYIRNGRLAFETGYEMTDEEATLATQTAEAALGFDGAELPRAVVVDVGLIQNEGWAVVEANGAWGSGIYGCDPDKVLDVIAHAVDRISERG